MIRQRIGKVYAIPPQPPVAEHTQWFEAGAVTIGVEFRDVNPDNLAATYEGTEYYDELLAKSPEGGFADEGVSIHVAGTDDGHEYVRFDVFDAEPHYHYIHKTPPGADPVNNVIDFDVVGHGDMLPWAISCLRDRLPAMIANAGNAELAARIDPTALAPVVDRVATLAEQARANLRRIGRDGSADSSRVRDIS